MLSSETLVRPHAANVTRPRSAIAVITNLNFIEPAAPVRCRTMDTKQQIAALSSSARSGRRRE